MAEKILVVEDDPSILRGLQINLGMEGYTVRSAMDGETGLSLARSERADLLVVDVMLPRMGGLEVVRAIREEDPDVPVLILCELALRGPLRPRDLLEATNLTSGGLTKQHDHLESLGLVERAFGTLREDRRASVVSLTPDGARAADAIGEAAESQLDEVRSLVDALTVLIER